MKLVYLRIGILCIVLYVALTFYGSLTLLQEDEQLNYLLQNFSRLSMLVMALMGTGLLAFLFLLLSKQGKVDIIYVKDVGRHFNGNSSGLPEELSVEQQLSPDQMALSIPRKMIEEVILKNQYNKKQLLDKFLQSLCNHLEAAVGAIYITKIAEDAKMVEMVASYAYFGQDTRSSTYEFGQGLVGQVAKNGKPISLRNVPDGYIKVVSGLGDATPAYLLIFPVKNEEEEVLGVIEIAAFKEFNEQDHNLLKEVALLLAKEIETNEYYNLSL
ncbi:MAG: GAF domain-containing protein [Bacteroidia bacterium]|nr:GAF domain-containing protein [Bacteroidia bacterium]